MLTPLPVPSVDGPSLFVATDRRTGHAGTSLRAGDDCLAGGTIKQESADPIAGLERGFVVKRSIIIASCLSLAVGIAAPTASASPEGRNAAPAQAAPAMRPDGMRLLVERASNRKVRLTAYRTINGRQPYPWVFRVKAKVRSKIIHRRMRTTADGGPGAITLPAQTKWVAVKDSRIGWKRKSVPAFVPPIPSSRILEVEAGAGDMGGGPAVYVTVTTRGTSRIGIRGVQPDGTRIDRSSPTATGEARTSLTLPPATRSVWVRIEEPVSGAKGWKKKWTAPPLADWQAPHRGSFTPAEANAVRLDIIQHLNQLRATARTCPSTPTQPAKSYSTQPPLPAMPAEWVQAADAAYAYFPQLNGWAWPPVMTPTVSLDIEAGADYENVEDLLDDIHHPQGMDIWCHATMQSDPARRLIVGLQRASHTYDNGYARNNMIEVGIYMGSLATP